MSLDAAACVAYDPAIWDTTTRNGVTSRIGFVTIAGTRWPRMKQIAYAKIVCSSCPALEACLETGKSEPENIWGGRLPDER